MNAEAVQGKSLPAVSSMNIMLSIDELNSVAGDRCR